VKPPDRPAANVELRIAAPLFRQIEQELRDGPRDAFEGERAGFLLCGVARLNDRTVLLARVWRAIPTHKRLHVAGYGLSWTADHNAAILDEADAANAVPVLVHRHDPRWVIGFSHLDRLAGDQLLSSLSRLVGGRIAGSVVLNDREAEGLFWENGALSGGLAELRSVGVPILRRGRAESRSSKVRPRLHRQTLAIGPEADAALTSTCIAVVGLSGGGSHVVQQVAHQGFGAVILIDDETVEETNRGRLVGSLHTDDGRLKTKVMRRLIKGIDPSIRVVEVPHRTSEPAGIEALKQADIVVACVDRFRDRAQISDLCRRYLIPLIDVGMTIRSDGGRLVQATGQVTLTLPGAPCLRCTPLVSDAVLAKEEREQPPGYDQNQYATGAPQVVSMNGLVASQAANLALAVATGYTSRQELNEGGWWQYDALEGRLDFTALSVRRPHCPGCAQDGHGDPVV
jgi:molybdopterin/thiamine biosynthesis adenylyltransferase